MSEENKTNDKPFLKTVEFPLDTIGPEYNEDEDKDDNADKYGKRGWLLDALVKVGQLEAALSHTDEQISYLKEQLSNTTDPEEITSIVDQISANVDIAKLDYENRVTIMNEMFLTLDGDRHYYCQVKHRAAEWVVACEVYHSRGCNIGDELSMHRAAQTLALTCSLAFGFKPFSCLRCLDEAIQEQDDID